MPSQDSTTTELIRTLERYGQSHLVAFIDELNTQQSITLRQQLDAVEFSQLADLFASRNKTQTWEELAGRADPPSAIRLKEPHPAITRTQAAERGGQVLSDGKIALIMVAGGQGTRLGFNHPKGMLPVGPVSGRTLFQIHFDKLMTVNRQFGRIIPLYIMTSPATHAETETWLAGNDWFGYPSGDRQIFCQGTMPAVDAESGRVLLSEKGQLFLGPDGHGGMLAALDRSGCLDDLVRRGVQQVFYCQVDNPLCQICDAATIGYHVLSDSEMTTQAIPKTDPLQKVGNLVGIDGKIHVIEYSDLPRQIASVRNPDGTLRLWAGSIAVHVIDVGFLNRMTRHADALPFHMACKKVSYMDSDGIRVEPDRPNAIKFEKFIFDLLPMAKHSIVVEVDPASAFAPVKNAAAESTSTVQTARQAMIDQCRIALRESGFEVDDSVPVEIHPALLADRQRLQERASEHSPIREPLWLK